MAGRRASKLQAPAPEFDDAEPHGELRRAEFGSEAASDAPSSRSGASSRRSPVPPQPPPVQYEAPAPVEEDEEDPDALPCWIDFEEDPVGWHCYHKIYNGGDRFALLTELWLETGQKGLEEEDLDDEEDAAKKAEKEDPKGLTEAEIKFENMQQQLSASRGHIVWMRGRDLRAELVDQAERRNMKAMSSSASYASSTATRMKPLGSLNPDMGLCWWVAPKYPKGAKKAGAPDTRRKKNWCWRSDFVAEVLHAATAMGMDYPVVDAVKARGAVRHNPELAIALRHHVAVISTDRQCKLWSPSFLQSLDVMRQRWHFGEEVRLEEVELMASYPEAIALFAQKKKEPSDREVTRMRVPQALLKAHRQPPPVVVPDRLPTRLAYKSENLGFGRLESQVSSRLSFNRMDSRRSLASAPGFQSAGRLAMRPPSAGPRVGRFESATSDVSAMRISKRVSFSEEALGPGSPV